MAEALQDNPVAQRVRLVEFQSSGHIVLIVDNAVMFQVVSGEVLQRKKRDAYSGIDKLAMEIISDAMWKDRSPD